MTVRVLGSLEQGLEAVCLSRLWKFDATAIVYRGEQLFQLAYVSNNLVFISPASKSVFGAQFYLESFIARYRQIGDDEVKALMPKPRVM